MIDIDPEAVEKRPLENDSYPGLDGKVAVVTGGSRSIIA
jgi:hypothetical protein